MYSNKSVFKPKCKKRCGNNLLLLTVGKTSERWAEAHMCLSERADAILNWTELWHTHSWSSPSMAQNQAENKGRKGGTKGRKRENKKVLSSREVNIETSSHQTTSHASVYHNASQTSHWASDYHTASPNQGLPQRITKPRNATLHLQTKDCHSESPNQGLPHCISS